MRLSGVYFVALAMAIAGPVQAAGPAWSAITDEPVLLQGQAEMHGIGQALWLRGAARPAVVEIAAPVIEMTSYPNEVDVVAHGGGATLAQAAPLATGPIGRTVAPSETARYENVRTYLVGGNAEGLIRLAWGDATDLSVALDMPGHLYPDAASAAANGSIEHGAGLDDAFDVFAPPKGHFRVQGSQATLDFQGSPSMWLRGIQLRLEHDGGIDVLDSRVSSHAAGNDHTGAAVSSWTDFILAAPEGVEARIVWPGQVDVFGETMRLQTTDGLAFADPLMLGGGDEKVRVLDGPTNADVQATSTADGDASRWTALQSPSTAAFRTPLVTDMPTLLAAMAAGATLAVGATLAILYWRRTRVVATTEPSHPDTTGMRLYHEHRFKEAIGPLRDAVKAAPGNHELSYALGVSLLRTGHFKDAFGHLRTAVRHMPIMLQMLVTSPETEQVRNDRRFESFIREEARVFKDAETTSHFGYC